MDPSTKALQKRIVKCHKCRYIVWSVKIPNYLCCCVFMKYFSFFLLYLNLGKQRVGSLLLALFSAETSSDLTNEEYATV